jgi:acetyl esterase
MAELEPGLRGYVDAALAAPPAWERTLVELRTATDGEAVDLWGDVPAVETVEDVELAGPGGPLRIRVYRPEGGPHPAIVWLHGGGWVVGSLASHDPVLRALAARTPCCVVAVDYRLAPEAPFPAALDDAWAALAWTAARAAELGTDPARLAVGGDSAGGNLAAVLARHARDRGVRLALQALVYPVTDHDFESPSYRRHAEGLNLTRAKMQWYWDSYLAGHDPHDPDASPLRAADLAGVAPAVVQVAEHDPLLSEGEAYARRLADAGVAVTLTRYDGVIHGFNRMAALTPQAVEALDEVASAIRLS